MKDLVVLCPDKKIEATILGLLERPAALGVRHVTHTVIVAAGRDPACLNRPHEYLHPYRGDHDRALVMFDRACDFGARMTAAEMEEAVRSRMAPDWDTRADAVVIDPELEMWVFSDSPHVDRALGWQDHTPPLRQWLTDEGLLELGATKPGDPKAAVEAAAKEVRSRWTAGTCRELAASVSLSRCTDPSFARLRAILVAWFPCTPPR